jgi:hypothetical protein
MKVATSATLGGAVMQPMMRFTHAALLLIVLMAAGCAGPEFQPYVGGSPTKGTGGSVVKRDGIDVWTTGSPPRSYRIIGIVEEEGGGHATHNTVLGDCVSTAKTNGGDAVVLLGEASGGINLYSGSLNRPRIRVAVIKYL